MGCMENNCKQTSTLRKGEMKKITFQTRRPYCIAQGNYIQYPVINHNGRENRKESIHVYNSVTLLYSRDWHNTANQLYLIKVSK